MAAVSTAVEDILFRDLPAAGSKACAAEVGAGLTAGEPEYNATTHRTSSPKRQWLSFRLEECECSSNRRRPQGQDRIK